MKKIISALLPALLFSVILQAQADSRLKQRLDSTLLLTKQLEFEKLMDFTYPKLFTIVPKDDMINAMKEGFNSEDFTVKLDSIEVISISPVFTLAEGSFAKIKHSMLTIMVFKEKPENAEVILDALKEQYGEKSVRFDENNKTFKISTPAELVAVKDKYAKDWCFVNYKKDDQITDMLFSKEVLDKLAAL